MKYSNHLGVGKKEVTFKSKKVVSSINSSTFESSIKMLNGLPRSTGVIPPGFEHRPDLIANLFYGTPAFDWVILWVNNISDPFQQLNVGDRITIVDIV
tara:strand:- start:401 stop:694 length:294 start_codon:yes stop_codon:yes gene_type:complete